MLLTGPGGGTGAGPLSPDTHLLGRFVPGASEVRAGVEGTGTCCLSLPSRSCVPQPSEAPVKLNTAALLREGSLYRRQVEKELQR